MAIQHRRGAGADFDPTRLLPGEYAVVQSGDADTADGLAVYICMAAGKVKRIATADELKACVDAARQALSNVEGDLSGVDEAEAARAAAERSRADAESLRAAAEARRAADFADMEQRSRGWLLHYCSAGEYDPETRAPTVSDPDTGTLYFTPSGAPTDRSRWLEWSWDRPGSRWEMQGESEMALTPLSTSQIDGLLDGAPPQGYEVLTGAGLSYLWSLLATMTVGEAFGEDGA